MTSSAYKIQVAYLLLKVVCSRMEMASVTGNSVIFAIGEYKNEDIDRLQRHGAIDGGSL